MGGKSEIRPGKKGKTLKGPPKPQVETKVVSSGRWRQKPQETLDLKKKKKARRRPIVEPLDNGRTVALSVTLVFGPFQLLSLLCSH